MIYIIADIYVYTTTHFILQSLSGSDNWFEFRIISQYLVKEIVYGLCKQERVAGQEIG